MLHGVHDRQIVGLGSEDVSVTFGPEGGVPTAVAKLFTWPASISAWVIV